MPKSRGRRTRHRPISTSRSSGRPRADVRAKAFDALPVVRAVDAAELRGDAREAVRLVAEDLQVRGVDEPFWRPERIRRLLELVQLDGLLPRWATSRWILAQAHQALDPDLRDRHLEAMRIAVETRGGAATLTGVDELDARAKVMDHDWVYRQVLLHDLGCLRHFVAHTASRRLLARADRISEWVRVPMGAYRLRGASPRLLTWLDLGTGEEVESLNIGSAALLETGDCAIGRLCPVSDGAIFESAPLFVPDDVAHSVADDPPSWVSAVARGCRRRDADGDPEMTTVNDLEWPLLVDVPQFWRIAQAERWSDRRLPAAGDLTPEVVTDLQQDLVRAALDGLIPIHDEGCALRSWPSVAAAATDTSVLEGLHLDADDAPALHRLAGLLPEPAGPACIQLASRLERAA